MTFELAFVDAALKERRKLDSNTREQFRKKLLERCANPRVPGQTFRKQGSLQVKPRGVGCRLVYEVRDTEILVVVLDVGKRNGNEVYRMADRREV